MQKDFAKGDKRRAKAPNVGHENVAWKMNQRYHDLSKAAHLCDSNLLDYFYRSEAYPHENLEGRVFWLLPIYREGDAVNLFAIHVGLIVQLGWETNTLSLEFYGEGANALESYALQASVHYLQQSRISCGEELTSKP